MSPPPRSRSSPFREALAPQPALYPHARSVADIRERSPSPVRFDVQTVSEVVERTVTPEAHMYFRRIVQVTQNELEKLLVYKIQQIFDPVAPMRSARLAVEELGAGAGVMGVDLQLPGVQIATGEAALEGRVQRALLREPFCTKEKTAEEGNRLTKYVVGVVGRILGDFSRFAETVLRWQRRSASDYGGDNRAFVGEGAFFSGLGVNAGHVAGQSNEDAQSQLDELVERLERQNHQNTELEGKYNSVAAELRESRRAFLRERFVWRERLRRLQFALTKHVGDRAVAQLLDHDVQFYSGVEGHDDDVDATREKYEQKIAAMICQHEEETRSLEKDIEELEAQLRAEGEKGRNTRRQLTLAKSAAKQAIGGEDPAIAAARHTEHTELFEALREARQEVADLEEALSAMQEVNKQICEERDQLAARPDDSESQQVRIAELEASSKRLREEADLQRQKEERLQQQIQQQKQQLEQQLQQLQRLQDLQEQQLQQQQIQLYQQREQQRLHMLFQGQSLAEDTQQQPHQREQQQGQQLQHHLQQRQELDEERRIQRLQYHWQASHGDPDAGESDSSVSQRLEHTDEFGRPGDTTPHHSGHDRALRQRRLETQSIAPDDDRTPADSAQGSHLRQSRRRSLVPRDMVISVASSVDEERDRLKRELQGLREQLEDSLARDAQEDEAYELGGLRRQTSERELRNVGVQAAESPSPKAHRADNAGQQSRSTLPEAAVQTDSITVEEELDKLRQTCDVLRSNLTEARVALRAAIIMRKLFSPTRVDITFDSEAASGPRGRKSVVEEDRSQNVVSACKRLRESESDASAGPRGRQKIDAETAWPQRASLASKRSREEAKRVAGKGLPTSGGKSTSPPPKAEAGSKAALFLSPSGTDDPTSVAGTIIRSGARLGGGTFASHAQPTKQSHHPQSQPDEEASGLPLPAQMEEPVGAGLGQLDSVATSTKRIGSRIGGGGMVHLKKDAGLPLNFGVHSDEDRLAASYVFEASGNKKAIDEDTSAHVDPLEGGAGEVVHSTTQWRVLEGYSVAAQGSCARPVSRPVSAFDARCPLGGGWHLSGQVFEAAKSAADCVRALSMALDASDPCLAVGANTANAATVAGPEGLHNDDASATVDPLKGERARLRDGGTRSTPDIRPFSAAEVAGERTSRRHGSVGRLASSLRPSSASSIGQGDKGRAQRRSSKDEGCRERKQLVSSTPLPEVPSASQGQGRPQSTSRAGKLSSNTDFQFPAEKTRALVEKLRQSRPATAGGAYSWK